MEPLIARDLDLTAGSSYDLVIVGGGIYGVATALEAARRRLRPLLVERRDFGGETSWNSLRIVHGGIRYLQAMDLRRFRESVTERRWWLHNFPDLVEPLPCLMPLYGRGLRRPSIFRLALGIDQLLSPDRNLKLRSDRALRSGRILSVDEVLAACPQADSRGLVGGALWNDAAMPDSQRLLIEMLHWAASCGAQALNYVEAVRLRVDDGRVRGIEVVDVQSDRTLEVATPIVVNCAGPWCREVARSFDRDVPDLFWPSVAFNAFLDRAPLFDGAVAVEPPTPGSRTYFLHRWKGRILAGTYHSRWSKAESTETVERRLLPKFIEDLNTAIPGFDLQPSEILRVHWGFLPARRNGSEDPASREMIRHHADLGGPKGLFSVSGVKFTTARRVAQRTLSRICRWQGQRMPRLEDLPRPNARPPMPWKEFETLLRKDKAQARKYVARLVAEESIIHLDDLLFRRTDWGTYPSEAEDRKRQVASVLDPGMAGFHQLAIASEVLPASDPTWPEST